MSHISTNISDGNFTFDNRIKPRLLKFQFKLGERRHKGLNILYLNFAKWQLSIIRLGKKRYRNIYNETINFFEEGGRAKGWYLAWSMRASRISKIHSKALTKTGITLQKRPCPMCDISQDLLVLILTRSLYLHFELAFSKNMFTGILKWFCKYPMFNLYFSKKKRETDLLISYIQRMFLQTINSK